MKTIDISGMGGGYEATCQAMLIAGMKWLKEHPQFSFNGYKSFERIYGVVIPPETQLAKELDDTLLAAAQGDCTGAMHQGVISHLAYIHVKGHDAWLEEAAKQGREIIEIDEKDIENQVLLARIEWQLKLDGGYNPAAELFKKIPMDDVIRVDPQDPESIKRAAEEIAWRIKQ